MLVTTVGQGTVQLHAQQERTDHRLVNRHDESGTGAFPMHDDGERVDEDGVAGPGALVQRAEQWFDLAPRLARLHGHQGCRAGGLQEALSHCGSDGGSRSRSFPPGA